MYQHKPGVDVDTRLIAARFEADADVEDEAAGYAPTPGLAAKVERLEREYLETYGVKAPESTTLVLMRRRERLASNGPG